MQSASTKRDSHVATAIGTAGAAHILVTIHCYASKGSNGIRRDVAKPHIETSHRCHDAVPFSRVFEQKGNKAKN
jgi:hypothetical protein